MRLKAGTFAPLWCLLLAGPVIAADAGPAPQIYNVVPAPTPWTSTYVGLNAGGGWAELQSTATFMGASVSASEKLTGIVGGAQVGATWQVSAIVLGAEVDAQGSTQTHSVTLGTATATDKITYFETVRARMGVAIDRFQPYATGGWGYGNFESSVSVGNLSIDSTTKHSLWVAGAGIEALVMPNMSVKLEYLYLSTGSISTPIGAVNVSSTLHDSVLRAGINVRF